MAVAIRFEFCLTDPLLLFIWPLQLPDAALLWSENPRAHGSAALAQLTVCIYTISCAPFSYGRATISRPRPWRARITATGELPGFAEYTYDTAQPVAIEKVLAPAFAYHPSPNLGSLSRCTPSCKCQSLHPAVSSGQAD